MLNNSWKCMLLTIVVLSIVLQSPAVADIECGGTTVEYPGVGELSTVISLPDDFNGVSLDPPPAGSQTKTTSDGVNIKATYRWEHVATFAMRSATGSLTTSHWSGVTQSSSVTNGFGFSISSSVSVGAGVPDIEQIKVTLTDTFDYETSVTSSISSYDETGLTRVLNLAKNSAVQLWRLAIDHEAVDTGASYTIGTDNTISCSYSLDFSKQLYVRIAGNNYEMPDPPTDEDGHIVHYSAPPSQTFSPTTVYLLANKPRMQADALIHQMQTHDAHWGFNFPGSITYRDHNNTYWSNLNTEPFGGGWGDCHLIGTGPADPVAGLPFYPTCVGLTKDCVLDAYNAYCADAKVSQIDCVGDSASLAKGCQVNTENKGPCMIQYKNGDIGSFVADVCRDFSTIRAGGVPTWMDRSGRESIDPIKVSVGWKSEATSSQTVSADVILDHETGVDEGKSTTEEFSESIGIEVEASGTFDVVSVSGKLSTTFSASQSTTWGMEISSDNKRTFTAHFDSAIAAYDLYSLTAAYEVDSDHKTYVLDTVSNFVVLLDTGE